MSVITRILKLFPALLGLIRGVESEFPETGNGPVKLALVMAAIEVAVDGFQEIAPLIKRLIDKIVSIFNDHKVFTK